MPRCNWWGSSSGPATGQYFGPATVAPFLATSNLSGACKPIASLGTAAVPTLEGNSGSHIVTLTVTLNGPSDSTVTVPWHTSDGTAGSGDYAGAFGTSRSPRGRPRSRSTSRSRVTPPSRPTENFFVNLGASATATLGNAQQRIVIRNDEKPTLIVTAPASIAEGTNKMFSVTLAQQYYQPITVTITTVNGTATSPSDYAAISKSKTFPAGTTTVGLPALPAIQVNADGAANPRRPSTSSPRAR